MSDLGTQNDINVLPVVTDPDTSKDSGSDKSLAGVTCIRVPKPQTTGQDIWRPTMDRAECPIPDIRETFCSPQEKILEANPTGTNENHPAGSKCGNDFVADV